MNDSIFVRNQSKVVWSSDSVATILAEKRRKCPPEERCCSFYETVQNGNGSHDYIVWLVRLAEDKQECVVGFANEIASKKERRRTRTLRILPWALSGILTLLVLLNWYFGLSGHNF